MKEEAEEIGGKRKPSALYVYLILKKYSSVEHKLIREDVISLIQKDFGIKIAPKTVTSSFQILEDIPSLGFHQCGNSGAYIDKPLPNIGVLEMLYVLGTARSTTQCLFDDSWKALRQFAHESEASSIEDAIPRLIVGSSDMPTDFEAVSENIKLIIKAMKENKTISFCHRQNLDDEEGVHLENIPSFTPFFFFVKKSHLTLIGGRKAKDLQNEDLQGELYATCVLNISDIKEVMEEKPLTVEQCTKLNSKQLEKIIAGTPIIADGTFTPRASGSYLMEIIRGSVLAKAKRFFGDLISVIGKREIVRKGETVYSYQVSIKADPHYVASWVLVNADNIKLPDNSLLRNIVKSKANAALASLQEKKA